MRIRWSKHKYDIRKRPAQNELATHCHKDHDLEKDLEVFILDHGVSSIAEGTCLEDRYTHQSNKDGMNLDVHSYAKEMYKSGRLLPSHQKKPP